jgi:hypothetical protein
MSLYKGCWRSTMTVAIMSVTAAVAFAPIASAASGQLSTTREGADHGVRAGRAGNLVPPTEISCIMSFAESDYHYGATPSKTLTTFSWGTNRSLPIECRGTINGLPIDSARRSYFNEHGMETATCTQGAGYAIARLTVPTSDARMRTLTMPLENTFTGTTFDIAGSDTGTGLGAVGSWALPSSSAPCPATDTGPIKSIQVAHAFQIYNLGSR